MSNYKSVFDQYDDEFKEAKNREEKKQDMALIKDGEYQIIIQDCQIIKTKNDKLCVKWDLLFLINDKKLIVTQFDEISKDKIKFLFYKFNALRYYSMTKASDITDVIDSGELKGRETLARVKNGVSEKTGNTYLNIYFLDEERIKPEKEYQVDEEVIY